MELLGWMEQWNMFPDTGGTVLCAVSGGRDSVCLLYYLLKRCLIINENAFFGNMLDLGFDERKEKTLNNFK